MTNLGRIITGLSLVFSTSVIAADTFKFKNLDVVNINKNIKETQRIPNRAHQESALQQDYTEQVLRLANLGPDHKLKKIKQTIDKRRVRHTRYQQFYQGVPVWGQHVVIHTDNNNVLKKLNGNVAVGVDADIVVKGGMTPKIDKARALALLKQKYKLNKTNASPQFSRENIKLIIYLNDKNQSALAYHLSFMVQSDTGHVARPTYIVDAHSGRVLTQRERFKIG